MDYTTLFFDLDDTLYASGNGLWLAIRDRMGVYMSQRMGFSEEEILRLRRSYFEQYGTTLRGLQIHHQVDADDFLAYVHDLPLGEYLQPAPELRRMLLSLPQTRWIFTNADEQHARRVLKVLDLEDCFQGILDLRARDFVCKPEVKAYQLAQTLAGEPDPQRCVLFDDSPRNLAPAYHLGFTTVLVGQEISGFDGRGSRTGEVATHHLPDLLDLPAIMPELWPPAPGL